MGKLRVFVAVPLPEELIHRIGAIQQTLDREISGVRWTRAEQVHLTLSFFAGLPEEDLDKIAEIMLSVSHSHPAFTVAASGIGAFPSPSRPRVFWLGLHPIDRLVDLQADLTRGFRRLGLPTEDRPFKPHLTLGRARGKVRGAAPVFERHRGLSCGTLPVERLILYESRLQPSGALHIPRQAVHLGASREEPER